MTAVPTCCTSGGPIKQLGIVGDACGYPLTIYNGALVCRKCDLLPPLKELK